MHLFRLISHSRWKQIKIKLNNKMKEGKKQKKKDTAQIYFMQFNFQWGLLNWRITKKIKCRNKSAQIGNVCNESTRIFNAKTPKRFWSTFHFNAIRLTDILMFYISMLEFFFKYISLLLLLLLS